MSEVNIGAIVAIILFYVVLLAIGIYAARKRGKGAEEMMLAGRNLGWFIGICTMTGKSHNTTIILRAFERNFGFLWFFCYD